MVIVPDPHKKNFMLAGGCCSRILLLLLLFLRGSLAGAASSVEWAQNMCMGSLEKFTSKESVTFIHKSFIPIVHLSHKHSQC